MPIPDTPQTRQEQYLNAIATGDASGIPDTPQCRQEQYLDAIARNGSGSSSLPEVTSEDNGDVLTVVEGAWAKAAPSGGGVLMIEHDEALGSYNKTFREVGTAFLAGTTVIWYADAINGLYYLMDGFDELNLTVNFGGGNILMADSEDGYLFLPD